MLLKIVVAGVAALVLAAATGSADAKHHHAFSPGAPGIGDTYFPLDGNGGYDVKHYALNVRYDPATDRLDGVAEIRARAEQDLSQFNLDFHGLTVRDIRIGHRRATWSRDGDELTVIPRRGLRDGKRFTVTVVYDGVPETIGSALAGLSGFIHTDDGALVAGQPDVAATWFPVNDHPLDKAAYTFRVTVPAGREVVANGKLVRKRTRGGWTTWVWDARDPMASYLATIDVGEWDFDTARAGRIKILDAIDPDLFERVPPHSGQQLAMSQSANLTYKRLAHTITVPAGGADMTFWVTRDTEQNWDFMFVEAHTVGQDDWTTLPDLNGHTTPDTGFVCPFSLELHPFLAHYESDNGDGTCSPTGTTGTWSAVSGGSDGYEQWKIDLSKYAGKQVEVSISYASDDIFNFGGLFVDDIVVSTGEGSTSFEDGTLDGWSVPGAPAGSEPNVNDWRAGTPADEPQPVGEIARGALDRQPEILDFLSGIWGRYPFRTAGGIVDDVRGLGFALETQTRPVYARDFFEDRENPTDSVVVHELAHQWVGDSLALARWQDIWLNEGFATYSEWLWSEDQGRGTAQELFDVWTSFPADDPWWEVTIGDPGPDDLFAFQVYQRGAATLHALRLRIGDDAFFRLLRRWVALHRGGNVMIPQFTALAEAISGQDLDAFFDEWLFTPAKPSGLEVAATRATARGAAAPRLHEVQTLRR